MKRLTPVLAVVLLGSAALPATAVADDRRDPVQQFFWQLVERDARDRDDRLAGRFRGDDDDDDRGRRGGRDDDDDDGGWRGGRDDDDDGRGRGGRNDDDD